MKRSDFNYQLPNELIAQHPLAERNSSRLLHIENGCCHDKNFTDFIDLLNEDDLIILNDSKVIPARLFGNKQSGGKVEILIEKIIDKHQAIAHVRASKSPKSGAMVELSSGYKCQVMGREGDLFKLEFQGETGVTHILDKIGHVPLPPYITRSDNQEDVQRYQTVFAQRSGAVAAPTAGLHFDKAMLDAIAEKGVKTAFVTLHVGSGTFQPVRVEQLNEHIMHSEYYEVPDTTVRAILMSRYRGGRVIAIGTTAVRALESASQSGKLRSGVGDTELFITPGYEFITVDAMLTNFHLPESTLIMLVSAFAGYETTMSAYRHAIAKRYRFFSYGDAMFISS